MNSKGNRACRGTKKDGAPCNGIPSTGSLYCPFHDPERVQERMEWSRRGGKASSTQKRLQRLIGEVDELTTEDLMRLLSGALLMLLEGKLEPGHLSAMQGAAKTMDAIRRTSELERRLTELEAALSTGFRRVG